MDVLEKCVSVASGAVTRALDRTRVATKAHPYAAGAVALCGAYYFARSMYRRSKASRIEDATIVITGASSGIGAAVAKAVAREGAARVILMARTREKLNKVARAVNEIAGKRIAEVCVVDCSNASHLSSEAARLTGDFGTPDIVINSAGAGLWKTLWEMSESDVQTALSAPFVAAANTTRAFLPGMLKKKSGSIVNIQSPASMVVIPGATMYSATRWALRGLNLAISMDVRNTNIKVQEVILGETSSSYWTNNPKSRERIPGIARILLGSAISEEQAADATIDAIRSGRPWYTYPMMLTVLSGLNRCFPDTLQWSVAATGWKVDDENIDLAYDADVAFPLQPQKSPRAAGRPTLDLRDFKD